MAQRATVGIAVLLALACFSSWAAAENDTLLFTEDFLKGKINKAMMALPVSMKAAMNGTLKKAPATAPKLLNVSCLNTIAPEPLNWKMWCPGKHAKVTEWVDDVGSTHRKIELAPMPNMTAQKAVWFMTPAFPDTMVVNGKEFTKNQLWHPIDHVPKLEFKLSPNKNLLEPPLLNSKLNETYRAPKTQNPPKHYQVGMWVAAHDLAVNLPRNRYVLGMEYLGFQAFTLIVEFNDSPKGLVVSVEVILGAAAVGYDKKNPRSGVPKPAAAAANALLFETVMAPYRKNGDFKGALDAVTRHVVEEFGNLQHFVPLAWSASVPGKVMKELSEMKAALIAATSKLPIADLAAALNRTGLAAPSTSA